MVYIVYQNPNTDSIEFCFPVIDNIQHIIDKSIPKDADGNTVPHKVYDSISLKYFESYDFADNDMQQNRGKLHEIKKAEWRRLRTPLLQKYDVLFMKALEQSDSDEIARIKDIKQQLRDVTAIDVSELTNAELETFKPSILL